jgi:hypothetical protein
MSELCSVCQHPESAEEGEFIYLVGTVPNSPSPTPTLQQVHRGCEQYVITPTPAEGEAKAIEDEP